MDNLNGQFVAHATKTSPHQQTATRGIRLLREPFKESLWPGMAPSEDYLPSISDCDPRMVKLNDDMDKLGFTGDEKTRTIVLMGGTYDPLVFEMASRIVQCERAKARATSGRTIVYTKAGIFSVEASPSEVCHVYEKVNFICDTLLRTGFTTDDVIRKVTSMGGTLESPQAPHNVKGDE